MTLYYYDYYTHHSLDFFFFFNDTPTTEIYTLSLHDALPIYLSDLFFHVGEIRKPNRVVRAIVHDREKVKFTRDRKSTRLNSSHVENSYAVFCLKKKSKTII